MEIIVMTKNKSTTVTIGKDDNIKEKVTQAIVQNFTETAHETVDKTSDERPMLFEMLATSLKTRHGFNPTIVHSEMRLTDEAADYCFFKDVRTKAEARLNIKKRKAILLEGDDTAWNDDEFAFYRMSCKNFETYKKCENQVVIGLNYRKEMKNNMKPSTKQKSWAIKEDTRGRFILVSSEDKNTILDDAQGYGYKTAQNAAKAAWYKFDNGKVTLDKRSTTAKTFWRKNKTVADEARGFLTGFAKVLATGEYTMSDMVERINEACGVKIPEVWYLDYLEL